MSILRMLAVVVSVGACNANDPLVEIRDEARLFQTDSLSYTLRAGSVGYEGMIGVLFRNPRADTTYFVNCRGMTAVTLEKLVAGEWRQAYSPVMLQCLSPPIAVAPGTTASLPIPVFGGYPNSNNYPQFVDSDIRGIYRAVFSDAVTGYQDRLPFGERLPHDQRISNRFSLRVPTR